MNSVPANLPPLLLLAAGVALAPAPVLAQCSTTSTLVEEETRVAPGVLVDQILELAINDRGDWATEFDSTPGPGNSTAGVLKSGAPVFLKDVPLSDPPGALLIAVSRISLDGNGNLLCLISHDGGPGEPSGSGWYLNDKLLGATGVTVTGGVPVGSTIDYLSDPQLGDDGTIVARAMLQPSGDQALVRLQVDVATGAVTSAEALYAEGELVAGEPLLGWYPGHLATNDAGQVLFNAQTAYSPTFPPGNKRVVFLDHVVLAETGAVEPSSGRIWDEFESIALGNGGDWAIAGEFTFVQGLGRQAIVRNSELLIMEDLPLPSIAPAIVSDIGSKPISISQSGEVLWFGGFWTAGTGPGSGSGYGLFIDRELIVEEGVTQIAGGTVTNLQVGFDWFKLSPNGRYVAFWASVSGVGDGVFLLDRLTVGPLGTTLMVSCSGNPACLGSSGSTAAGQALTLEMDNGQQPGATALLALSSQPALGLSSCGVLVPGLGEVMVDIVFPNPIATFEQTWSGTPVLFPITMPTDPQLQGLSIYSQGVFIDSGPEPLRSTDGVEFVIG